MISLDGLECVLLDRNKSDGHAKCEGLGLNIAIEHHMHGQPFTWEITFKFVSSQD